MRRGREDPGHGEEAVQTPQVPGDLQAAVWGLGTQWALPGIVMATARATIGCECPSSDTAFCTSLARALPCSTCLCHLWLWDRESYWLICPGLSAFLPSSP